ncbi:MAG: succinate dehydrogenase iron-sulfur subunit [Chlamydiales bacterium]|nr:succinate dehydrogenase iron-sulfur subunit [Chlamydiales bacterium]
MGMKYICKIRRGSPGNQYWEEFELEHVPMANVISSLMEIQRNPINRAGARVAPVVWEQGCLEEVCGSCSMLINGVPRQACTALIAPIVEQTGSSTIVLAPMTKFPLVRDLIVDRSSMFENLKKVSAWIDSDGAYDRGAGPRLSQAKQEVRYALSTCMTCGCCSESCPQVNEHSKFMGPAPLAQVRLFNSHPFGHMQAAKRLRAVMGEEGVTGCGNAQNCVRVCPKKIPLTDAIAAIGRDVTLQTFRDLFSFPDRDNG